METEYTESLKSDLDYYKEELENNKCFNRFSEIPSIMELQKKNISISDKYFRRKIRYIKTELNRLRRNNQS